MNGTVAALEPMLAAGRGHVINVISLAGIVAAPGEVAYSASKHAAMAFTPRHALRSAPRRAPAAIDVSAVCPDGIWTPMLEDKLDDLDAAGSFSGHLLTAEEVASEVGKLTERPRPILDRPALARPAAASLRPLPAPGDPPAAGGDVGCAPTPAALQEADRVRPLAEVDGLRAATQI